MDKNETPNPYEDAKPIVVPHTAHHPSIDEAKGDARTSPRSRSVQSARDAAQHYKQKDDREESAEARDLDSRVPAVSDAERAATGPQQPRPAQPQRRQVHRTSEQHATSSTGALRARGPQYSSRLYSMRTRRKTNFGILVALILTAIALLAGLLYWINRPVPITVDGEAAEVRVGSTITDVAHEQRISVTPGNVVTVKGELLEAGTGYAFTATMNGEKLTREQIAEYRINGGEAIEFTDGEDITEDFTYTEDVLMPYLRMEGAGYAIQYISQWGRSGIVQHRHGTYSNEVADVITQEPQDCIITCRDFSFEDGKYVALTFDDGPLSPFTEQYLDIMDRYGVKATFFFLGESIEANPELARRVVEAGHQIANHTMAHNQLTAVDADTIYNEITRSAGVIQNATGVVTSHLRPPYGDFTERSWLGTRGCTTAAIRWTGDSRDWELPGAGAIIDNALLNVRSGSIILMHDGGGDRSQDVEALPGLIERLQADGYQFLTISDLMRKAGDIPEDICSGTATMPADAVWPNEIHPDDIAAAAS